MMRLTVMQGKAKHAVDCSADGTFLQVKQRVQELCGVVPASQKLIFKGKERKDGDSVAAAGVRDGDKLMLMLSAEGAKELKREEERLAGEQRQQEAAAAQRLKEQHRDGLAADATAAAPPAKTAVVEEEGAAVQGAQTVQIIHAKVRYKLVADFSSPTLTFLDLKEKLAKLCHVPAKHQRLVFKAKERDSAQTLVAAGVKSGDKMMLLLAEGEWRVRDEKELIRDVESELAAVETSVDKLKSQCQHGLLHDVTEISVKAGICFEAVERLADNIGYLAHVPEAASVQQALNQRLTSLAKVLEDVQSQYVLGRHASAVATGGSLYQRLDGPGL